eukprot:Gb_35688 [translate_table: standard]
MNKDECFPNVLTYTALMNGFCRCNCGNSKFGNIHCKLVIEKNPKNKDNTYNQKYKGMYCTCHRPYPDPEGEGQEEKIQCCICEDWFHENHLGLESTKQIPRDDEGETHIRGLCVSRICQSLFFLLQGDHCNTIDTWCKITNGAGITLQTSERKKALFQARNWRDLLCTCNNCYDLCTGMRVIFLLDKGDALEEYDNIAKKRREEKLQQQGVEVAFLQNLGHNQQIELLSGINDMNNELCSFLAVELWSRNESYVSACNALLDKYAKYGNMETARQLFDKIPERNIVSWECKGCCSSSI